MTNPPTRGDSAFARFAERTGINRPRTRIAAAVVGSVLLVSLFVMNQRIQARKVTSSQSADSLAAAPEVEPVDPGAPRAAWADPQEVRRLVGDTLEQTGRDTLGGDPYVPLGSDVGPGAYADAGRGDPPVIGDSSTSDTVPAPAGQAVYADGGDRPLSAAELRTMAFRRAVATRRLRPTTSATNSGSQEPPGSSARADSAAGIVTDELQPYGPEQVEADQRAAEQAASEVPPPVPPAVMRPAAFIHSDSRRFRFASSGRRPCGSGERVLSAGYVITATLTTAINSEAAGPVLARIGRDVYGPGLRCVIFPAGTLLVGRYPSGMEPAGQRLVVVWEQVVLADGTSWTLPKLPAADRAGRNGIAGEVDQRTRARFADVVMLSAIGAALEYATPGGGQSPGAGPGGYPSAESPRDRAVGGATAPIRGAAERLLERADAIRPVSRVDAGTPISVIVPRTVDLDQPVPVTADTVPRMPAATPSA